MERYSPIAVPGRSEQIYLELRERLLTGVLLPGDPITEEEIAAEFGCSRTPVREAINRLVADGLVSKGPRGMASVFRPSLADVLELYDIRIYLESLAAGLACEIMTDEESEELQGLAIEMQLASPERWFGLHDNFHSRIAEISSRPRLRDIIRTARAQTAPYVKFGVSTNPRFKDDREHVEIASALASGDRKVVERKVRRHLEKAKIQIEQLLVITNSWQGSSR